MNQRLRLLLFTTSDCHLCEQAEAIFAQIQLAHPKVERFRIEPVEITVSNELMDQYAIRIPVLKREDTQQEIAWPFNQQQLLDFLLVG